ncbi:MAG: histidine phosphatase family protein [Lachnospiraceae bacterium]|nr:histidine phosphatase family protein [Lachnospiraceae bacterium]
MIYIVRHGKTDRNKANVLQGRSDQPLNDEGVKEAKDAAEKLGSIRFSHVYSSPLRRAVETAKIIAPDFEPALDERLIEMDYGPYEGADLTNPSPELLAFFADFVNNPEPPGMESLGSVVSRLGSFIEDIRHLSGNILISSHAIAMKGALEYLTPGSNGSYWSKYIGNCAIYVTDNKDGIFTVPHELC